MKNKILTIAFLSVTLVLALVACKKNVLTVSPFDTTKGKASVKINYASAYSRNHGVQIKVDGVRMSNVITYATPFPGGGLGTGGSDYPNYLSLTPGQRTISISIPKAGSNEDSVTLFTTTVDLAADVFQTLHVSDTLTSTKGVLLNDYAGIPDSGYSKFAFINLIPGSSMDVYFNDVLLKGNVGYNQKTDTFSIIAGTASFFRIRPAGALPTSTALASYPTTTTAYAIPNQRAMTIFARGYTGTTATDIRRPFVSLLFNK